MKTFSKGNILVRVQYNLLWIEAFQRGTELRPNLAGVVNPKEWIGCPGQRRLIGVE